MIAVDINETIKDIVVNVVLIVLTWLLHGKIKSKYLEDSAMGSLLTVLTNMFKLLPYVVAGVQTIHANESTETKTQLAQDALSIATQGAIATLGPQNAQIAQAVSNAVSNAITGVQGVITATQSTATTQQPVVSLLK